MFNLKNIYWAYWGASGLTKKICNEIIKQGLFQRKEMGVTGGNTEPKNKKELKKLQKIRNSEISWINQFWVYKEIRPYIEASNKAAGWNYQYDSFEKCQFTIYDSSKGKQHYDWHTDGKPGEGSTKCRKISTSILLNDPSEYEGGELLFRSYVPPYDNVPKIIHTKEIMQQGTVITFPSFVMHKVTPVTKGIRYSLVIWHRGDNFK